MNANVDHRNRQPKGRPIGGQFAEQSKVASGVSLTDEPEHLRVLDSLQGRDRELAHMLLGQYEPDIEYEHLQTYEAASDDDQFAAQTYEVARLLAQQYAAERAAPTPHVAVNPGHLGLDEYTPGSYTVKVPDRDGFDVSRTYPLTAATDDLDAEGFASALASARALDRQFDEIYTHQRKIAPPTMAQMRAAVQVADWQVAEAKVRFVEEIDGRDSDVRQATVRSGRYTADGAPAQHKAADADTYVRLTMSTGLERFVPFSQVQQWVSEHRIAADD